MVAPPLTMMRVAPNHGQPGDPGLATLLIIAAGVPLMAYIALRSAAHCRLTRAQRFRLHIARSIHP